MGFTSNSNSSSHSSIPVKTWFKDALVAAPDPTWRRWSNERADPCAFPTAAAGSNAGQLTPPANSSLVAGWLAAITTWRDNCAAKLQLNGSVYRDIPQLKWTQSTFIQPQIHPWDNYFWDHVSRGEFMNTGNLSLLVIHGSVRIIDCL
jgi:hypothetical protein